MTESPGYRTSRKRGTDTRLGHKKYKQCNICPLCPLFFLRTQPLFPRIVTAAIGIPPMLSSCPRIIYLPPISNQAEQASFHGQSEVRSKVNTKSNSSILSSHSHLNKRRTAPNDANHVQERRRKKK